MRNRFEELAEFACPNAEAGGPRVFRALFAQVSPKKCRPVASRGIIAVRSAAVRGELPEINMSSDAKLGLIVGLGLVLLIAQVFYRRDGASGRSLTDGATVQSTSARPPGGPVHSSQTSSFSAAPDPAPTSE